MKKTSRRSFGKRITGALVALPIASLATTPGASAQTGNQAKTPGTRPAEVESMHNTPPPLVISDGSLIIESDDEFINVQGNSLYKGHGRPKIAHIRVFRGNGDKIYEDLEADSPLTKIDIAWKNEDNAMGNMRVSGGTEFKIDSDRILQHQPAPPPAATKRRMHQYHHQGGGAKRVRIESIEITNSLGAKTKFTAMPTGTADAFLPDEFRILIWRHD